MNLQGLAALNVLPGRTVGASLQGLCSVLTTRIYSIHANQADFYFFFTYSGNIKALRNRKFWCDFLLWVKLIFLIETLFNGARLSTWAKVQINGGCGRQSGLGPRIGRHKT